MPGLAVMPATPADAYGLMRAAIRADHPSSTSCPCRCSPHWGRSLHPMPLSRSARHRSRAGTDLTLVTYGRMRLRAMDTAARLDSEHGISVEVVDLRTLKPLDAEAILGSVEKTGRLMILHEALGPHGIGTEIAALAANEGFTFLDRARGATSPPVRKRPGVSGTRRSQDPRCRRRGGCGAFARRVVMTVSGRLVVGFRARSAEAVSSVTVGPRTPANG